MAKKATYNFGQEMYKVLVIAHNMGNTKAINKDMVAGADIDATFLTQWIYDVRTLQGAVSDYVMKKKNANVDSTITEGDVYAARQRIYPKWKEILRCGEKDKYSKELHVQESDIEDLYGYACKFMSTVNGTIETLQTEKMFRKSVESLLGCRIAGNRVLDAEKRDILEAYYSASKSVAHYIDIIADLEGKKKDWQMLIPADASDDAKKIVNDQILKIDDAIKTAKENKQKAEAKEREFSTRAMKIENEIKVASAKKIK